MSDFIQGAEQDVVLASRVRLSRNFDDLPFSPKLSQSFAEEVIDRASEAVLSSGDGHEFKTIKLRDLTAEARNRLVEHYLISYDLLKYVDRAGAMVHQGGTATVMCNEEDHVRLQGLLPGLALAEAADIALRLDTLVSSRHPFAFDTQLGFLTACPANVGTGMRCSILLHLPATSGSGQMGALIQTVAKLGLTIRGLYGEGAEARGHLYQLSNQATLGHSEDDVVRSLLAAAEQIVAHERTARERFEKTDMTQLQDRLLRSWGELLYARLMNVREFMRRYSDVRYAASMGYLHAELPRLDQLMMDLQPGSIAIRAGKPVTEREADELRAKVLREELTKFVSA